MMQDFLVVCRKKDNPATEGAKDEDGISGLLSSKFNPVTMSTQEFYKQVCMYIWCYLHVVYIFEIIN